MHGGYSCFLIEYYVFQQQHDYLKTFFMYLYDMIVSKIFVEDTGWDLGTT